MTKEYKNQQKSTDSTSLSTGLSPIQEQCAILLATGENITSVADKLNINRTTIYQWQQKITFQCFFNLQRKDLKDNLRNGLCGMYDEALQAIRDCLQSNNESIKLKSAMLILEKVENMPNGTTDAREVLRKQATHNNTWDWALEKEELDEIEYQKLLKQNGLNND